MKKALHRFLCWDDQLIERCENVRVQAHRPEKKNIALKDDFFCLCTKKVDTSFDASTYIFKV